MKALIITNLTKKIQSGHFTMIDSLIDLGYEVHWASNFSQNQETLNQKVVKLHQIDFIRNPLNIKNIKAYNQLMILLKTEKYDIIHCNSPIGGILGRICGRRANVKKIIYMAHGFHFFNGAPLINNLIYKNIEKLLAKITDTIITITKEDFFSAKNFNEKCSVKYIPGMGVDQKSIFDIKINKNKIYEELKIDNNSFIILSVGELNKNKNHKIIIKALANSNLSNKNNIHYLICGVGPEKENLIELARNLGLEENVHFLNYRNDVIELMKASNIFIMPSLREGLSRAIIEAMMSGVPVIASKIRGNVDLIKDGRNGYLVAARDDVEFANSIKYLYENEHICKKISENNIKDSKKYDIYNIKKEMKEIYINTIYVN